MAERVSFPYHVEASAGAEGYVEVARVPGGVSFVTRQVNITFPAASDYELHIAFYRGIRKVLPTTGTYVGDDTRITDETPAVWGPDESVILYYKNDNAGAAKECDVLLEGELR